MNKDLVKQYLFVIIRYATPYVAGWLAAKTGVTTDAAAAWIATTVNMLMFVWSLFNKARYEEKVNTALDLPEGSSKNRLKTVILNGDGVPATEKK